MESDGTIEVNMRVQSWWLVRLCCFLMGRRWTYLIRVSGGGHCAVFSMRHSSHSRE